METREAREKLRKIIQQEFARIKSENRGQLGKAAYEIGVDRQQLQQWARGVPVPSDVLLMAFMKWGISLELRDDRAKHNETKWWKFSMSGRDGGFQKAHPKPTQMSLFDALEDLQEQDVEVKILKKTMGRLELGVDIGFKKVRF